MKWVCSQIQKSMSANRCGICEIWCVFVCVHRHGCPCVFGQPLPLSSGVAFWEVNMGPNRRWRVGMAYRSVDVKRLYTADVQPDHGFYSLWLVEETLLALTKPEHTKVIPGTLLDHQTVDSTRVRVLLEYEDQRVTLLWNKNFTSRFSFTNLTLTEPLAPYICTYGSKPITFIKPENFLNIPSNSTWAFYKSIESVSYLEHH